MWLVDPSSSWTHSTVLIIDRLCPILRFRQTEVHHLEEEMGGERHKRVRTFSVVTSETETTQGGPGPYVEITLK